jgi:hypothetical protein
MTQLVTLKRGNVVKIKGEQVEIDALKAQGFVEVKPLANSAPTPAQPAQSRQGTDSADGTQDAPQEAPALEPSRTVGSRAQWVKYATSLGIDVPDGAKRDQIIKLVDGA